MNLEIRNILRPHGSAKEIALSELAIQRLQHHGLFLVFDPFGHHADVQIIGQLRGGLDQGHEIPPAIDIGDEGPVNLQPVNGELVQAGQRGVPRSKIIHIDLNADFLNRL